MTFDPLARYLNLRSMRSERRSNLRAMNSGEMITTASQVYRTLGWPILRLTSGPAVLILAGWLFFAEFVVPGFFLTSNAERIDVQATEVGISLLLAGFVAIPLMAAGLSISTAVIVNLTSDYMIGNVPDVRNAVQNAMRVWWRLLMCLLRQVFLGGLGLLMSLGLFLVSALAPSDNVWFAGSFAMMAVYGFFAGFVFLLWVFGRESLAIPATIIEDLRPGAAAKRSIQLMRGSRSHPSGWGSVWNVFGLVVVVVLFLWAGIGSAIGILSMFNIDVTRAEVLPFGSLLVKAIGYVPLFFAIWLIVPLWGTAATINYYERRVRLEGFDVEVLAQDVWRRTKGARYQL